ncbi:unnamed protein product [Urochloa decumbens]|uniref:Uncharacterized protein n=1 Tax=Urochloa decumbens TaxID=240449 RepID=A0ABC8WQP0_9POAL
MEGILLNHSLLILLVPGHFFNFKKPTDSYLGKYWTALIFFTIFIIGMMVLVLSTSLLISTDPQVWPAWTDTVSSQHIIFFLGLYMVAIGYGGQYPCVTSFGADQFDDTDEEERTQKSSFFNWNHFTLNVGALISGTIIVWIQDHEATCNFDKDLPCDCSLLYEIPGQGSGIEGSRKLEHTTGLEFFDKAAIVTSADCESVGLLNTWRVCTVTQVEEFKILIRILPIWTTMVLFNTALAQMFSTFIEQGMVMEKHIGSFEIPAASFQSVDVIAVLALVPVYERVLVPVFRKFTGMANGITPLQRMGIGLFFSTLSMLSAAMVESNRLRMVQDKGLVNQNVAAPMSILWQGPQYFLLGAGEVFSIIGLNEFFYKESPDAMRSISLAFSNANISAGNYLSSFIVSLVPVFTAREGSPGWIPDNLNEGHLDRFFWMMAGLCFLNLLAFVFCAMKYKCKKTS